MLAQRSLHARRRRGRAAGFTLLEVLLVLAILVVLASLAVGVFSGAQTRANIDAAKHDATEIGNAAQRYYFFNKQYPAQLEDLKTAPSGMDVSQWGGPHLDHTFLDPWGANYIIVGPVDATNSKLEIISCGPDMTQGTADDISNVVRQ